MKKPKVVYWNNLPAPYIVDRFNAVKARGNLDFEGWFSDRSHPERTWDVKEEEWLFDYKYIPRKKFGSVEIKWPFNLIRDTNPDLLISLFSTPEFILGWRYAHHRGLKTGFWAQVTMDAWVRRRFYKDAIRRYMFRRSDVVLGSGEDSRRYAIKYGASTSAARVLRHAVDVKYYRRASLISRTEREEVRRELKLGRLVFIYIGRLWEGKGVGLLLQAFNDCLTKNGRDISLLILGDGVDEKVYRSYCEEKGMMDNVVFAGYIQKDELPKYLGIADVFVCPSFGDPYCTAIDEAMAASLPIVVTDCVGEVNIRVVNGINGFIYPSKSREALRGIINMFTHMDISDIKKMGSESWERIHPYTLDRWAADLEYIAERVLSGET